MDNVVQLSTTAESSDYDTDYDPDDTDDTMSCGSSGKYFNFYILLILKYIFIFNI